MNKITFGYIVGGKDKHYNNLLRSIESLEKISQPYNILVLDADNRLDVNGLDNVKVIHFPVKNESNDDWFQPHYWKMRYHLYEYLDTPYCFYMDTDTVIINDRVDELIEESSEDFLICNHWWVPTLNDYISNVRVSRTSSAKFISEPDKIPYVSSGLFLFQKDKHNYIFEKFSENFNSIFENVKSYNDIEGITDEFILSVTLNETGGYKFTNGSMNHSSEREQMPLYFDEDEKTFYGKNPQDEEYKKVFAFHNDIQEIPTLSYFRDRQSDITDSFIDNFKKVCYLEK